MHLRGPLNDYELRPWSEAGLHGSGAAERIVDRGDAARILRRLLDEDPGSAFGLRRLAVDVRSGWMHDDNHELAGRLADAIAAGALLFTRTLRPITTSDTITRIEKYEPEPLQPYEELEVYLRVFSECEEWPSLEVESESEEWPSLEVADEGELWPSLELNGEFEQLGFSVGEPRKHAAREPKAR